MRRDHRIDRAMDFVGLIFLGISGVALWFVPVWSPATLELTLMSALGPLIQGWRAARGTALRPVLIWSVVAVLLAMVAQISGLLEPLDLGRPWMGRWTYLAVLASLAALISVLNARTPGAGAWALLMVMLMVVFLIPWLEEPGRFRRALGLGQLRLASPWTIFFILVAGTGVTNYLPTRYGPAALIVGIGYLCEYLALSRADWSPSARLTAWSSFSWCLAAAIWTVHSRAIEQSHARSATVQNRLTADWLWFRDHWGVVWGLRTAERFNAAAVRAKWPVRLGWYGAIPLEESGAEPKETASVPQAAVSTFHGLIRRFVKPERFAEIRAED